MPYDLYLSRGVFFGVEADPGVPDPDPGKAPVGAEEFHALLRGAPAERKGERTYWVRHPDGDPWFVAQWQPRGQVLLSTSYSHHRYLRNFGDLVEHGLELARALDAHLFEEVRGIEITERDVDELLEPSGAYVQQQAATWRGAVEQMARDAGAALEYPLGQVDLVSEYLGFHLAPARAVGEAEVAALLQGAAGGARVSVVQAQAWAIADADGERELTKVMLLPDGRWQIWPWWGRAPFPRLAETTLAAAEALERALGGELRLLGEPLDEALREEVRRRIGGLGVEFFLWKRRPEGLGPE